mgnify:CR=1 FL=1
MRPTSDTTIRRSLPLPDGGRPPQAGAIAKLAAFSPSIVALNSVAGTQPYTNGAFTSGGASPLNSGAKVCPPTIM